jgi:predicted nucleotidyltransferase
VKVRTRDFIYTKDDLFFATTSYIHPKDRIISFLRYIPNSNGDRESNGKKYSKVTSNEAYNYLKEYYPEYLYFCDVTQVEMMGVPLNRFKRIIKPEERLKSIRENNEFSGDDILKKVLDLSDFFHYKSGIPYENLGVSGSILVNLHKNSVSDLDFVIYGLKNHRIAIETFKKLKDKKIEIPEIKKTITLNGIQNSYWDQIYNKRLKDSSLTKKEFCWYENRKNNRGTIDNYLFDILATRNWDEISGHWGGVVYKPVGKSTIECKVKNAIESFDNPSIYEIETTKIIEGDNLKIDEIASFTHTYAGQAIEGEELIAKGKVELVSENEKEDYYRLVVGTTRESLDEFIKLKNSPF